MDGRRFDQYCRRLAKAIGRRALLGRAVAAAAGVVGLESTAAVREATAQCQREGWSCRNYPCCSGLHCSHDPLQPPGFYLRCCPKGAVLCNFNCVSCDPPQVLEPQSCTCTMTSDFEVLNDFQSSSGNTRILYLTHTDIALPGGQGTYRGSLGVGAGYELADVFLTGFRMETAAVVGAVSQIAAEVSIDRYDPALGLLDLRVAAALVTDPRQDAFAQVGVVVVLSSPDVASFAQVGGGCANEPPTPGSCVVRDSVSNAIPASMKFVGLATRHLAITSRSPVGVWYVGTTTDNTGGVVVQAPSLAVNVGCTLTDDNAANDMYCEWGGAGVSFVPSEMEPSGIAYPIIQAARQRRLTTRSDRLQNPSGASIVGGLDALRACGLRFENNRAGLVARNVWAVSCSFDGITVEAGPPGAFESSHTHFLGSYFGDTQVTDPFVYGNERAFGFLR